MRFPINKYATKDFRFWYTHFRPPQKVNQHFKTSYPSMPVSDLCKRYTTTTNRPILKESFQSLEEKEKAIKTSALILIHPFRIQEKEHHHKPKTSDLGILICTSAKGLLRQRDLRSQYPHSRPPQKAHHDNPKSSGHGTPVTVAQLKFFKGTGAGFQSRSL